MASGKILVVDDSRDMQCLLTDCLTAAGYDIETASDGNEAYDIALRQSFDLVITDIDMPRCNGIELLERLHANFDDVSVIMITGYADINSARESIVRGAADYISKPFKSDEILASIQRTLRQSHEEKENTRLRETHELFNVSKTIVSKTGDDSPFNDILISAVNQTRSSCAATIL